MGGILIPDPPTPGASDNHALAGNILSNCSHFLLCNMRVSQQSSSPLFIISLFLTSAQVKTETKTEEEGGMTIRILGASGAINYCNDKVALHSCFLLLVRFYSDIIRCQGVTRQKSDFSTTPRSVSLRGDDF